MQGGAYEAAYTEEDMLTKMMEWGEDSIYWRTEYECQFVESVSNVFNPEKLKACMEEYDLDTLETARENGEHYSNISVGVDIGKSVNSTVISVWRTEKTDTQNIARLIYIEEITPKTGDMIFHINVSVSLTLPQLLMLVVLLLMLLGLVVRLNRTSE